MILTLICWVALIAFIGLTVKKFMEYGKLPQHGRQDLYPIPLESEEKFKYGGSYMEDDKWYEKERQHNLKGEILDMLVEMLFIKKLFVNQNSFWWLSYSLHLGLYAAIAWSVLVLIGAFLPVCFLTGIVTFLTILAGIIAGVLMTVGTIGLLCKRLFVREFKVYTTPQEYFNLVILLATSALGLVNWLGDMQFEFGRNIARAMFTFQPLSNFYDGSVPAVLVLFIIMLAFISIYIPLTKLSHYVGKYYTFHKVIWDNAPNMPGSKVEANIIAAANKPKNPDALKWEAPHAQGPVEAETPVQK
ncbi:MAG: respiratory nitrate reductase subunit gamma [Peptococcaceae bacterium]